MEDLSKVPTFTRRVEQTEFYVTLLTSQTSKSNALYSGYKGRRGPLKKNPTHGYVHVTPCPSYLRSLPHTAALNDLSVVPGM